MFDTSYNSNAIALSLPLTSAQRATAKKFAMQQLDHAKSRQIELNTLAIFGVKNYLELMGIATNLENSDSWNAAVRLCADVADLEITAVGKLECIPILANISTIYVPEEVLADRIGCVIVEITESRQQAILKGFLTAGREDEIKIDSLLPIESLLDRIDELENIINLKHWLNQIFEKNWHPVAEILSINKVNANFRLQLRDEERKNAINYAEAGKLIDLGIHLQGFPVALVLDFKPEDDENTSIRLQVHPGKDEQFLPSNLELMVLDDSGAVFLEAKSRAMDNYIQLLFSGRSQEHFSIKIAFANVSIVEKFVI